MRNKLSNLGKILASLATLSAGGCFQYGASPMPQISVERCSYQKAHNGVRIGVEPFETPQEAEFFNKPNEVQKNIRQEGLLPLYVTLSPQKTQINQQSTKFVDSQGNEWKYISPQEAAKNVPTPEKTLRRIAGSLIGGGMLSTAFIVYTDREREKDYLSKSFSNENGSGFIFLKSPRNSPVGNLQNGKFFLYLENSGAKEEIILP